MILHEALPMACCGLATRVTRHRDPEQRHLAPSHGVQPPLARKVSGLWVVGVMMGLIAAK